MRALLEELARAPGRPRTFPEIEDALGWPRRRIASVLGGVARLRMLEFGGRRPVPLPRRPRLGLGPLGAVDGRGAGRRGPRGRRRRLAVAAVPAGRGGLLAARPVAPPWAGLIVSGSPRGLAVAGAHDARCGRARAPPLMRRSATRANVRVDAGSVNDAMPLAVELRRALAAPAVVPAVVELQRRDEAGRRRHRVRLEEEPAAAMADAEMRVEPRRDLRRDLGRVAARRAHAVARALHRRGRDGVRARPPRARRPAARSPCRRPPCARARPGRCRPERGRRS